MMKVLYNLKTNFRISLTLTILLVTLILTSFIEKQHLKSIDRGFSSLFADRLVPATDMFFIVDQLYERRMALQAQLLAPGEQGTPMLQEQNKRIDSLLAKYQETYLVEDEVVCLKTLMQEWKLYQAHEAKVLSLLQLQDKSEAIKLFNTEGDALFRSIVADLENLTRIQSQVGQDLMNTSKSSISSSDSLLTLQSGIILIVAIITNIFLLAAKVIDRPLQKFHLN